MNEFGGQTSLGWDLGSLVCLRKTPHTKGLHLWHGPSCRAVWSEKLAEGFYVNVFCGIRTDILWITRLMHKQLHLSNWSSVAPISLPFSIYSICKLCHICLCLPVPACGTLRKSVPTRKISASNLRVKSGL